MKFTKSHPVFLESLAGALTVLVLAFFVIYRSAREKEAFYSTEGSIVFLDSTYNDLPLRDMGKYRYLKVDSYPKVFELFTGSDPGDFPPKYEKLNDLKVGDRVTIWYDENEFTQDDEVNRLVQYIEKNGQPYFILGNKNIWIGIVLLFLAFALIILVVYLKKAGKII